MKLRIDLQKAAEAEAFGALAVGAILDPILGCHKEAPEKRAEDYKDGYQAGARQRVADATKSKK